MIFRPFVVFRGRLLHDGLKPLNAPIYDGSGIPAWINELCDHTIRGCRRIISRLGRIYFSGEPVYVGCIPLPVTAL